MREVIDFMQYAENISLAFICEYLDITYQALIDTRIECPEFDAEIKKAQDRRCELVEQSIVDAALGHATELTIEEKPLLDPDTKLPKLDDNGQVQWVPTWRRQKKMPPDVEAGKWYLLHHSDKFAGDADDLTPEQLKAELLKRLIETKPEAKGKRTPARQTGKRRAKDQAPKLAPPDPKPDDKTDKPS